jgi:hypothetical protein
MSQAEEAATPRSATSEILLIRGVTFVYVVLGTWAVALAIRYAILPIVEELAGKQTRAIFSFSAEIAVSLAAGAGMTFQQWRVERHKKEVIRQRGEIGALKAENDDLRQRLEASRTTRPTSVTLPTDVLATEAPDRPGLGS